MFYSLAATPPPGAFPLWTGEWILNCKNVYPTFYQKAVEYRDQGRLRVLDNASYEHELAAQGQTGAFVIQGNDIRLPKIVNWIGGFTDATSVGRVLPAGLPNITGTFGTHYEGGIVQSGAFTGVNSGYDYKGGGANDSIIYTFDASKSSSVYGASNTVQPPSVQMALYIQVYHGVTEQSFIDVSRLTDQISQLSAKVTELTQQLNTFKTTNFGVPDHANRVDLTPDTTATEVRYTPRVNGYICGYFRRSGDGQTQINLTIDNVTYTNWSRPAEYYQNGHSAVLMPVRAGSNVVITKAAGNWNNATRWCYFIPCV